MSRSWLPAESGFLIFMRQNLRSFSIASLRLFPLVIKIKTEVNSDFIFDRA